MWYRSSQWLTKDSETFRGMGILKKLKFLIFVEFFGTPSLTKWNIKYLISCCPNRTIRFKPGSAKFIFQNNVVFFSPPELPVWRHNFQWYFTYFCGGSVTQLGSPVHVFLLKRLFNSQLAGTPIVCTHSRLYSFFILQSFHLEILNTDFLTIRKFWRYYLHVY